MNSILEKFKKSRFVITFIPISSLFGFNFLFKLCSFLMNRFFIQPFTFAIDWNKVDNSKFKMWKCRKCGKDVYFAEKKSSLGYDWHPECLRCEECDKRLNPGQHAEHKGVPYCYIPCYGALFGPELYGHGSRIDSHTSFGKLKKSENDYQQGIEKALLEQKLREYNQYYVNKFPKNIINCRERNGKLILEGPLYIYWDISNQLILKEENDDRLLMIRRRNTFTYKKKLRKRCSSENKDDNDSLDQFFNQNCNKNLNTIKNSEQFYLDENFKTNNQKIKDTNCEKKVSQFNLNEQESNRKKNGIKKSQVKLRRRCSINGHYYNRETCVFTPDPGTVTSVWITSLVNTTEVISQLLDKFKVTNQPQDFSMFIVRDNGECRRIQDSEYPLLSKVLLGPNEDAARVFILNRERKEINFEVAQYLNFSNVELQLFLKKFEEEEQKEIEKIKNKFENAKKYIQNLIEEYEKA